MALASVTSSNISYQPKDSIKQHILNNLTNKKIVVYDQIPDLTQVSFARFPFIVIPQDDLVPYDETTLRQNIQYSNNVEGTMFHDKTKLSDNQMRILRQDLITAFTTFTNTQLLAGYGLTNIQITFSPMSPIATIMDQFAVVEQQFNITYDLDVNMSS